LQKILYHDKCFDGFTAAWAAWKRFGDSAVYMPVSYGTLLPVIEAGDEVYFLDFCPPVDYLRNLGSSMHLVILDHHKSAEEDLRAFKPLPTDEIIFDMNRSGAGIAWDYFHMEPRPKLVDYAEDHDLWRYALPDSRCIRAYMHSMPYTWHAWEILHAQLQSPARFMDCVDRGESIQDFMDQQVKAICDRAVMRVIVPNGPLVPVVNATTLFSEVGEELNLRYPDAYYSAYYFDRGDGKRQWGLRTKQPGVDVSVVAQMKGGGGHKAAAGWVENNT
jgi:hypothetical protein